jgi:imidazolonepropionase
MRKVTLVRGARQLLTLRGPSGPRRGADLRNLGIIQDGAVLIADGLIAEVGPSRRVENLALARGAAEIDASGCVVMPGFVDSHIHVVSGAPAVARTIQGLSPRVLKTLATRVVEEAVRHGTTAIEAKSGAMEEKSGLGLTEAGELKILRVHAALQELPLTLVSTFLAGYPAVGERLLPKLRRRKLAEFAEIRCEEDAFTPAQVCRYRSMARELGLGLKVYAGQRSYPEAIAMAVETGAISVSGLVDATERDAILLARSQTIATLLPGPALNLGAERRAPARMLIDNGAAVALASGYHPEDAPSPNMRMTIALACRAMNMTAAEAIAASTINGAHAMRRAGSIGSLEAGKSADLAMLGVPDYRELPYHFGVNLVNLVMIRGTVLLERSEVKWPGRVSAR